VIWFCRDEVITLLLKFNVFKYESYTDISKYPMFQAMTFKRPQIAEVIAKKIAPHLSEREHMATLDHAQLNHYWEIYHDLSLQSSTTAHEEEKAFKQPVDNI